MSPELCPHCDHVWAGHAPNDGRKGCIGCGCPWADPRIPQSPPLRSRPEYPEYPYEGVIDAAALYEAFWTAAQTLGDDESVHDMDKPYLDQEMDMIDCSGCGMPYAFWNHMARALTGSA